jgi:hypothetical protein
MAYDKEPLRFCRILITNVLFNSLALSQNDRDKNHFARDSRTCISLTFEFTHALALDT